MPIKEKLERLDFAGIILIIGVVCCLVLALHWGGESMPWSSARVIGLFVGAGLLLLVFGFVQWKKGGSATIPLRVLRQRSIFMGAWYAFFLEMAIYVVFTTCQLEFGTFLIRGRIFTTSLSTSSPRSLYLQPRVEFGRYRWVSHK